MATAHILKDKLQLRKELHYCNVNREKIKKGRMKYIN